MRVSERVSKPFDASPKALMQYGPADWPAFLGVKTQSVEIMDAELSTVTASTDKVLRLRSADGDCIQHYDFQSGPYRSLPGRVFWYSALLGHKHKLPVDSVVVLLCRKANLGAITGVYERTLPGEARPYVNFRYRVVRVWELPVETVLSAGVAVLPLAPISKVSKDQLPEVIERMERRFAGLVDENLAGELWTATRILMGLRYDDKVASQLLRGVRNMRESTTYQAILKEGEAKGIAKGEVKGEVKGVAKGRAVEARQLLLRLGSKRFQGPPNEEQARRLEALSDVEQIEKLAERILDVTTWTELLAAAESSPPRRRKRS